MTHITHQRNKDFIEQCRKSAEALRLRGKKPALEDIVRHALAQPAPKYYVNPYRAIANLEKCLTPRDNKYAASRIWRDMAIDIRRLRTTYPRTSLRWLVKQLCLGNAGRPRYYISPRRALEIVVTSNFSAA